VATSFGRARAGGIFLTMTLSQRADRWFRRISRVISGRQPHARVNLHAVTSEGVRLRVDLPSDDSGMFSHAVPVSIVAAGWTLAFELRYPLARERYACRRSTWFPLAASLHVANQQAVHVAHLLRGARPGSGMVSRRARCDNFASLDLAPGVRLPA